MLRTVQEYIQGGKWLMVTQIAQHVIIDSATARKIIDGVPLPAKFAY